MRTYWLIPGFALLLLGAGCALSKSQTNQTAQESVPELPTSKSEVAPLQAERAVPAEESAPALSASDSEPARVITLNAGEFYFEPSSIFAKAGEQVIINFGTVVGTHTFAIDELGISQTMTSGGSVSFTAPATSGRYTYYCSVGPHRTLGMTGTLAIE